MESLYLLIPLSAGLVLVIIAVFGWALHRGQFEDLEAEGARILQEDLASVDADQVMQARPREQSRDLKNHHRS
jgi:cbb3-type cytochrome oxidase maturation protein